MDDTGIPSIPASVGQRLAHARQASGLSVGDVSERIKLTPRQIEALENDRFSEIGHVFSRGFVRSYARLVGLDADALVADLPRTGAQDRDTLNIHDEHIPLKRNLPGYWPFLVLIVLLLVLILPWLAYRWLSSDMPTTPATEHHPASTSRTVVPTPASIPAPASSGAAVTVVPTGNATPPATPTRTTGPLAAPASLATRADASALPAQQVPAHDIPVKDIPAQNVPAKDIAPVTGAAASPPAAATNARHLQLQFLGDAWLNIHDGQGHRVISRLYPAGSQASFDVAPPVALIIGNSASVRLTSDGQPIDLVPYTPGKVARFTLH